MDRTETQKRDLIQKIKADQEKRQRLTEALRKLSKGKPQQESEVPSKKKSKPLPYKMQNTWERNLRGVPGGGWAKEVWAPRTGTVVRKEGIGVLRSARNCNTTQGSYIQTIVQETGGRVVSDRQGRKEFGR